MREDVSSISKIKSLRLTDNTEKEEDDIVVREVPCTIEIGGKRLVSLLCTPTDLKPLACGFLISSGLIEGIKDISSIEVAGNNVKIEGKMRREFEDEEKIFTSGCGRGVVLVGSIYNTFVDSCFTISPESIYNLMRKFQEISAVFKATGGIHSAGLSDGREIISFKEDIGRHNAVDKLIGDWLLRECSLYDKIILISGRISYEMIIKVVRVGVPLLISRSAPTDLAIKIAESTGVTLIGFVRGRRMNVYTHRKRVIS